MDSNPEIPSNLPPFEPIAESGSPALLPFPRHYTQRGSPFHVPPVGYLYVSQKANQNVRKRFLQLTEKIAALGMRAQINSAPQLGPLQAVFTDSAQYPKWVHVDPMLRGEAARADGYKLTVNQDGVVLHANDENGILYGCLTLLQLIEDGPDIPGMDIEDFPLLPYRAVHLDFKGWAPTGEWLRAAIDTLAGLKVNILIFEYESHFAYPSLPELAADGALTPQEIQDLDAYARDNGVRLVPLLSCVGNAGHVLARSEYAGLREHPDCARMYCVASTDAQNLLVAQLTDLLPLHPGKMAHIGGDGAFVLGTNPATQKRAEELGGVEAVYLDHIGALCRFLAGQSVQPLIWDELLREMSDDQIKWLTPDAAFIFWLPEGLTPGLAPDVIANLERYKVLRRSVWGSCVVSPAAAFGAFDCIDAWADVGQLNYISGFVATVRTREFARGGMLPAAESAWAAILYAADRAWSGKNTIVRELFPQRFAMRFFRQRNLENQSRIWAGYENLMTGNPGSAYQFFKSETAAPKNAETLRFMETWSGLQEFLRLALEIEAEIRENFVNIQTGSADALQGGLLRWRTQELKARAPNLIANFSQAAERICGEWAVHEYVESALAYTLRRLDELEPLLAGFELPAETFREPLAI
ncbi:MAG TPA: glycoside hydrolase family 20 zincin-like fold domain-containing protein [Planctomycetota bacterium]|nr:glycoside hydrolase family 20 zincin-like fold domain-containing protein [Planctomycetota bacterium]